MAAHPPDEVRPGLYLGGYLSLPYAHDLGIQAVLSVVNGDLSRTMSLDLLGETPITDRLHVDLPDDATTNLLQHFPACLKFITANLQAGRKVLVHCAAGVSRSATVVTSYVMVEQQMSSDLALKYVQLKHPAAWPNQGFRYQLKLFEDMACKLDVNYEPYRRFMLSTLTQQNVSSQEALPSPVEPGPEEREQMTFRCRKCRTLLATSCHVVDAEAEAAGSIDAADERIDDWRAKYSGGSCSNLANAGRTNRSLDNQSSLSASSVWLMPLRWMSGILGNKVQGKLYCPKCTSRLGSFNWSGMKSAGGHWVTPAFQLHGNNVDSETVGGLDNLAGLRISQPRSIRLPGQPSPTAPGTAAFAEASHATQPAGQGEGQAHARFTAANNDRDTSTAVAVAETESKAAQECEDPASQQPETSRRAQTAADEAFARVAAKTQAQK